MKFRHQRHEQIQHWLRARIRELTWSAPPHILVQTPPVPPPPCVHVCSYCAHVLLRSFLIPAHTLSTVSMETVPPPMCWCWSRVLRGPPLKDLGGVSGCVGSYELVIMDGMDGWGDEVGVNARDFDVCPRINL